MAVESYQFAGTEVSLEQSDTTLFIEEEELGIGKLRISEQAVSWISCDGEKEFNLSFPCIAVHAISRDTTVFPFRPCIFLLYSVLDMDDAEIETQEEVIHYRLAPPEAELLDAIFGVISECQKLYPDSDLSSDSEDDMEPVRNDYFTTAEGLQYLSSEGEAILVQMDSILHIQGEENEVMQNGLSEEYKDQFEDADVISSD